MSVISVIGSASGRLAAAYFSDLPPIGMADAIAGTLEPLTRRGGFGAPYAAPRRAAADLLDRLDACELKEADAAATGARDRAEVTDEKLVSIGGVLDVADKLRGSAKQVRAAHVVIAPLPGCATS